MCGDLERKQRRRRMTATAERRLTGGEGGWGRLFGCGHVSVPVWD